MTAQQEADTASTQLPADAGTVDAADPTTTMAPPETNHPAIHTTTSSSSSSTRLSKTTACLPIVYGSVAHYLGKKADEFQTHEWTLYLRGPNQDDLSLVVSKVVFQLHASFAQPIRELPQPPFEVTERGWGEFEAQIKIHWKDVTEKPTVVSTYLLFLFQNILYRTIQMILFVVLVKSMYLVLVSWYIPELIHSFIHSFLIFHFLRSTI